MASRRPHPEEAVGCDYCGAAPGQRCQGRNGMAQLSHAGRYHKWTYGDSRPDGFDCDYCGKRFVDALSAYRHQYHSPYAREVPCPKTPEQDIGSVDVAAFLQRKADEYKARKGSHG